MSALTIMFVRHGEKPGGAFPGPGITPEGAVDDKSLVVRGWQRAGAWAGLFVAGPSDYPRANVVYAAAPRPLTKKAEFSHRRSRPPAPLQRVYRSTFGPRGASARSANSSTRSFI